MSERRSSFGYEDLSRLRPRRIVRPRQCAIAAAADADVRPDLGDRRKRRRARQGAWCAPNSTSSPTSGFSAAISRAIPVMPGCLGLDALWQMTGFFLGWLGLPGRGRALGVGEVKFADMVVPTVKKVVYGVDIRRIFRASSISRSPTAGWRRTASAYTKSLNMRVGLIGAQPAPERGSGDKLGFPIGGAMTRVVVTGMGIVSSIGNNSQEVLASLHSARSGIVARRKIRRTRLPLPSARRPDLRARGDPSTAAPCASTAAAPPGTMSRWIRRSATAASGPTRFPTSAPGSSWARAAPRRAPSSRRRT